MKSDHADRLPTLKAREQTLRRGTLPEGWKRLTITQTAKRGVDGSPNADVIIGKQLDESGDGAHVVDETNGVDCPRPHNRDRIRLRNLE